MNRRDFLLFRTEHQTRIVELSCERLYMRYLDSQATTRPVDEPVGRDSWDGEPPAQLEARTTRQLFDDLDRELQSVDIVRLADTDWLASDEFRRLVELLISTFCARGGRVEYGPHRGERHDH